MCRAAVGSVSRSDGEPIAKGFGLNSNSIIAAHARAQPKYYATLWNTMEFVWNVMGDMEYFAFMVLHEMARGFGASLLGQLPG